MPLPIQKLSPAQRIGISQALAQDLAGVGISLLQKSGGKFLEFGAYIMSALISVDIICPFGFAALQS